MIRRAGLGDFKQLLEIGEAYYELGHFARYGFSYDEKSLMKFIAGLIASPNADILVFEIDGRIVSTAAVLLDQWFMDESQWMAYELWWFVDPEHRGNGVAQKMMKALEEWADERGATCLKMASLCNEHQKRLDVYYEKKGLLPSDHFFVRRIK